MLCTFSDKQLLEKLADGDVRSIVRAARNVAQICRAIAARIAKGVVRDVRSHRSSRLERACRDDEGAGIAMNASIVPRYPLTFFKAVQDPPAKPHDEPSVLLR